MFAKKVSAYGSNTYCSLSNERKTTTNWRSCKKLNDSESLHKRRVTSRGAWTSNAWGKELTWRMWAGMKTAIWAPEKVKPVVCAVPSRTLRASATLYIQSCEHTDINAWVKNVGGLLWDLSGGILRLLYHYWKAVEIGEDQRKAKIVLILKKAKKSWELQAGHACFGPWEDHGAILPGRIKFWPHFEMAVGSVTSQNLSQPQWFCDSMECTYTEIFKIPYTAQSVRLACSVTLQVNHFYLYHMKSVS